MTATVTQRTHETRRVCITLTTYETIANLNKKYGCNVSKVSDHYDRETGDIVTVIYFGIPLVNVEAYNREEVLSK